MYTTFNSIKSMNKFVNFVLTLFVSVSCLGQIKNSDGNIVLPKELSDYMKLEDINLLYTGRVLASSLTYTGNKTWYVYSDRENNPAYRDASKSRRTSLPLQFMERLVVREIKGTMFHVYNPRMEVSSGIFEDDIDRGWVDIANLVISPFAVLNEKSSPKKYMALFAYSEGLTPSDFQQKVEAGYAVYHTPTKDRIDHESNAFQIRYIFKQSNPGVGGVLLLSNTDRLSGSQIDLLSQMEGWMRESDCTPWDHRVCLEPSTSRAANNDYKDQVVPVYMERRDLKIKLEKGIDNYDKAITRLRVSKKRLSPYRMRMPIIESFDDRTMRVATIGSVGSKEIYSPEQVDSARKALVELTDLTKQVNILFVIDGTKSMEEFYAPIMTSIEQILRNKDKMGSKTTIRFGAIVYRDYSEGNDAFEVKEVTGNYEEVIEFLSQIKCYSTSRDRSKAEAMYNAIINGVDRAGLVPKQSNVLVLIGDCGNHINDQKGYELEDVVDELTPYSPSIITFQAYYGMDDSYDKFNDDAGDLMREMGALTKRESKIMTNDALERTKYLSIKNQEGLEVALFHNKFGRFTYAEFDQKMNPDILEVNLTQSVSKYLQNLDIRKNKINEIISGKTSSNSKIQGAQYNEEILRIAAERLYEQDPSNSMDYYMDMIRSMKEFSFQGYTSMVFNSRASECYDPVVFLSDKELDDVLDLFGKFRISGSNFDKREALYNALREQTMKMLGAENSENIDNKSLNEIWDIILNVPFDENNFYAALADMPLKDLKNVEGEDFETFLYSFEKKVEGFNKANFKSSRFMIADTYFYWIPLSKFPGND